MVLARSFLVLTLFTGCAAARTATPPEPPQPLAEQPPPRVDDIVAARLPVAYRDVHRLARVLHDILEVRPDRGDVRAILHDSRESTLLVFATPAGHATVRQLLATLVSSAAS